jgi:hypothetical protein
MAEFPAEPIAPDAFFQGYLPQAFQEAKLPRPLRSIDLDLGVKLDGDGGGEWVVRFAGGRLAVAAGSREKAAFTLVQSVADWQGALWAGRGGTVGRYTCAFFRPARRARAAGPSALAAASPAALAQMGELSGLVQVVLTGGSDGDWSVGLQLGPGEIPAAPTATLRMGAADADALASGDLGPVQAFLTGKVRLDGDLGLLLRMQSVAFRAA